MNRFILPLLLLMGLMGGCNAPTPPTDAPPPTPPNAEPVTIPQSELQPHIDDGVRFLRSQYHPHVGLLQESPSIDANRYYITNDNLLANHVLDRLGVEAAWVRDLAASLSDYEDALAALGLGIDGNGFIEAAWGEPIRWPPFHHLDVVVEPLTEQPCDTFDHEQEDTAADAGGGPCVLYETHLGPGYFSDWSGFSNLACMAVVDEWNRGHVESARRLFALQMQSFDGYGWPDLAYQRRGDVYETLGLAWCLYAAALIDAPTDQRLIEALLRQQDPETGGFHTHYGWDEPRRADPNVETTSMALLALHEWWQHPRQIAIDPAAWAADYLRRQYDPEIGLLRESIETAQYHYWLATDNRLAIAALRAAGEEDLAQRLEASIDRYGGTQHGVIEALTGGAVTTWPPYTETHTVVMSSQSLAGIDEPCQNHDAITTPIVCNETRLDGTPYPDWTEYADWLLYGTLAAAQQGPITHDGETHTARDLYARAIELFDGVGFADKAAEVRDKNGVIVAYRYATYKLALALIVGQRLGAPVDERILAALLAKQAPSGGFYTLYNQNGDPLSLDTNTETTSYALLALISGQ